MASSQQAQQEQRFNAILAKLERYFELKAQLGQQMKQGHLHLAQAKYAAAPGAIGQASYSGNMQPLIAVSTSYEDSDSLYPRFAAQDAAAGPAEGKQRPSGSRGSAKEATDDDLSCLPGDSTELNNDCSPSADQSQEASSAAHKGKGALESRQSLLKMFGFLAPPALKQAQACFAELLPVVMQLANLQQEVLELADEFGEAAEA